LPSTLKTTTLLTKHRFANFDSEKIHRILDRGDTCHIGVEIGVMRGARASCDKSVQVIAVTARAFGPLRVVGTKFPHPSEGP